MHSDNRQGKPGGKEKLSCSKATTDRTFRAWCMGILLWGDPEVIGAIELLPEGCAHHGGRYCNVPVQVTLHDISTLPEFILKSALSENFF
jgi:hypothetical protein